MINAFFHLASLSSKEKWSALEGEAEPHAPSRPPEPIAPFLTRFPTGNTEFTLQECECVNVVVRDGLSLSINQGCLKFGIVQVHCPRKGYLN
ncbi:Hypothetical predicted protein [Olea europaea subsp. europaea]|uniref:Uncharacterized protein n=1 Tax=Olea europaea subsp. europaea TaxID=158383 RepID=A0A8S0PR29_OLEEU|nr:Hypothetical predicted protein [Olea europaea subsp. europaea]